MAEAQAQTSMFAPALADLERRIETLLYQIEDDPQPSLLDRLTKREAERNEIKARIAAQAPASPGPAIPSLEDPQSLYVDQVRRLDTLLGSSGHVIAANELLRRLVARVVLCPHPEAPDGLAVDLRGDLSGVSWAPDPSTSPNPSKASFGKPLRSQTEEYPSARQQIRPGTIRQPKALRHRCGP